MLTASVNYELYNLSLVLQASLLEEATIALEDISGRKIETFVPRTSPGYITSQIKPYTHVVIEFPGKPPLEAHQGIRVAGHTGALHQCDIAVLTKAASERCQARRRTQHPEKPVWWSSPRARDLILAVECKFYEKSGLDLDLARSFIGLSSDISIRSFYFVTNTSISKSMRILLLSKYKKFEENINPSSVMGVDRLINSYRVDFRNYTYKY